MENRRSVPRMPVNMTAFLDKDGVCSSGRLLDLSIAGARLVTNRRLCKNDVGLLTFDTGSGRTLSLPSMVVWRRGSGGIWQYGLLFTKVDDDSLNHLAHVLDAMGQ